MLMMGLCRPHFELKQQLAIVAPAGDGDQFMGVLKVRDAGQFRIQISS
jgi:hypothetical protein